MICLVRLLYYYSLDSHMDGRGARQSHVISLTTYPIHHPFWLDMLSHTASRRHHRMRGYEVCIHTCGCRNQLGLHVRPKEGGSCVRHAKSRHVHRGCTAECPGHGAFTGSPDREACTRNLTREEIIASLPVDEANRELDRLRLQHLTKTEIQNMQMS